MEKHWSQSCELTAVLSSFRFGFDDNQQLLDLLYKVAEDDFFDGVEIRSCDDAATLEKIKPIIKVGHLSLDIFAQPGANSVKIDLDNKEKDIRQKTILWMEDLMRQVYPLQPRSLIFPYCFEKGTQYDESALQLIEDSTHQLCDLGKQFGLRLVMKIMDVKEPKESNNLSLKHYSELAKAISNNHNNFGLLYDFSSPFASDNHFERISLVKDYIKHIHVGKMDSGDDIFIYGDFHVDSCFAGSVSELVKMIKAMSADGFISDKSETKPVIGLSIQPYRPHSLLDLVLANAKRSWRQAWFEAV